MNTIHNYLSDETALLLLLLVLPLWLWVSLALWHIRQPKRHPIRQKPKRHAHIIIMQPNKTSAIMALMMQSAVIAGAVTGAIVTALTTLQAQNPPKRINKGGKSWH